MKGKARKAKYNYGEIYDIYEGVEKELADMQIYYQFVYKLTAWAAQVMAVKHVLFPYITGIDKLFSLLVKANRVDARYFAVRCKKYRRMIKAVMSHPDTVGVIQGEVDRQGAILDALHKYLQGEI